MLIARLITKSGPNFGLHEPMPTATQDPTSAVKQKLDRLTDAQAGMVVGDDVREFFEALRQERLVNGPTRIIRIDSLEDGYRVIAEGAPGSPYAKNDLLLVEDVPNEEVARVVYLMDQTDWSQYESEQSEAPCLLCGRPGVCPICGTQFEVPEEEDSESEGEPEQEDQAEAEGADDEPPLEPQVQDDEPKAPEPVVQSQQG